MKATDSVCELTRGLCGLGSVRRLPGQPDAHPPFSTHFSQLPTGLSQMLRAAKVFTKVTCALVSASLLLLSLWPLLLPRAL